MRMWQNLPDSRRRDGHRECLLCLGKRENLPGFSLLALWRLLLFCENVKKDFQFFVIYISMIKTLDTQCAPCYK